MEQCKRHAGCSAPADSGHWCPASPDQVRKLGYRPVAQPVLSPFVRRALSNELPAKAVTVR